MEFTKIKGLDVEISLQPVSRKEFFWGKQRTGFGMAKNRKPDDPITNVSASEAREFAGRMGGRLPTLEEIISLAAQIEHFPDSFACKTSDCLSEWLDCSPEWLDGNDELNCIVHPAWLRPKKGSSARGSIPNQRDPYVTFRVVRERQQC